MVKRLLSGWTMMRWLRLFLAVTISAQAFQSRDWMLGFLACVFLFQAVTNTGCCGDNGCAIPVSKTKAGETKDVEFEEL